MNFWFALHRALDYLFCDRCPLTYLPNWNWLSDFCPLNPIWNIVGDATDPRGSLSIEQVPDLFPRNFLRRVREKQALEWC